MSQQPTIRGYIVMLKLKRGQFEKTVTVRRVRSVLSYIYTFLFFFFSIICDPCFHTYGVFIGKYFDLFQVKHRKVSEIVNTLALLIQKLYGSSFLNRISDIWRPRLYLMNTILFKLASILQNNRYYLGNTAADILPKKVRCIVWCKVLLKPFST